jgi:acyl transferase domain-containing protein
LELKKQKKDFNAMAAKKAKATRGSKESELDAKVLAELDQKGKQYLTKEGS